MSPSLLPAPCIAALLLLAGCGDGGGADSPEALVGVMRDALASKDYAAMVGCSHPDDRPVMTAALVIGAHMLLEMSGRSVELGRGEHAAVVDRLKDLLDRYDLDVDRKTLPRLNDASALRKFAQGRFDSVDHRAFFADYMDILGDLPDMEQLDLLAGMRGELKDLEIDGNEATGTLDSKPVRFERYEGNWYFRIGT